MGPFAQPACVAPYNPPSSRILRRQLSPPRRAALSCVHTLVIVAHLHTGKRMSVQGLMRLGGEWAWGSRRRGEGWWEEKVRWSAIQTPMPPTSTGVSAWPERRPHSCLLQSEQGQPGV